VISATDDVHLLHVDAALSQSLDGPFGLGVVGEVCDRNVSAFHGRLLPKRWMKQRVSAF